MHMNFEQCLRIAMRITVVKYGGIIRTSHQLPRTQIKCCIYQLFIRDDFTFSSLRVLNQSISVKKIVLTTGIDTAINL